MGRQVIYADARSSSGAMVCRRKEEAAVECDGIEFRTRKRQRCQECGGGGVEQWRWRSGPPTSSGPQIDDGDWPEDLFCIAIDTYTVTLPPESVSSALLYGASQLDHAFRRHQPQSRHEQALEAAQAKGAAPLRYGAWPSSAYKRAAPRELTATLCSWLAWLSH